MAMNIIGAAQEMNKSHIDAKYRLFIYKKNKNTAPKMSPAKVMIKLTMVHFVEQTRKSLLPILSVLKVKILKSGISKNAGHLISIVRVLLHPTLTKRRLNA